MLKVELLKGSKSAFHFRVSQGITSSRSWETSFKRGMVIIIDGLDYKYFLNYEIDDLV
jgi:hypothetical protein